VDTAPYILTFRPSHSLRSAYRIGTSISGSLKASLCAADPQPSPSLLSLWPEKADLKDRYLVDGEKINYGSLSKHSVSIFSGHRNCYGKDGST
jgi:hypothetical protein